MKDRGLAVARVEVVVGMSVGLRRMVVVRVVMTVVVVGTGGWCLRVVLEVLGGDVGEIVFGYAWGG